MGQVRRMLSLEGKMRRVFTTVDCLVERSRIVSGQSLRIFDEYDCKVDDSAGR